MISASTIKDRYETLKQKRIGSESRWKSVAKFVMPQRDKPNGEPALFDATAIRANQTLANGQLAWMSPMESPWFDFGAEQGADDEAKLWLSQCTESTRHELAVSNFYTTSHEFYLDRSAFAIGCMYVEPAIKSLLNFQVWSPGCYVIDENHEGHVDTVFREFTLSARQAAQKFGEAALSKKTREMLADEKKRHDSVKFIHGIFPREKRDPSKADDVNKPWASVYIESDNDHIVRESGYDEQPFMVSRFLQWGSDEILGETSKSMYGWTPCFSALPDARQLQHIERCMDALAEKKAFPPVLAPDELEGEIDPNPHGVTYFSRDMASGGMMPKEWMTGGDYEIGLQRAEVKREAIRQAFFVDLFQMFAQIQKQMTAREVAERAQEKLIQFSPTFARLTTEFFNPLLARVFGILLRAGKFGDVTKIPESLMRRVDDKSVEVPVPKISYSSRIALALKALPTIGYSRTLERLSAVAQMSPDVLDNYNFDNAERATALADGVSADFMRKESEVKKIREARAQAQAQAAQAEAQERAASALGKVGGIKPDSMVAKAMEGQA